MSDPATPTRQIEMVEEVVNGERSMVRRDPPTPTRPRPGEPLTVEQIEWARRRASMKDELAKIVINVVAICDSHELLRQSLVALRTERDQWYDTCDKAWTACDECATAEPDHSLPAAVEKLRLRAEAAEAQRTEAEQALKALTLACSDALGRLQAHTSKGIDEDPRLEHIQAALDVANDLIARGTPQGTPQDQESGT